MDYLCVLGPIQQERAPRWDKIELLQRACRRRPLESLVIWVDADAVVVDLEVSPREILPKEAAFGMASLPDGLNSGVIAFRVCEEVQGFLDAVWDHYPVDHPQEERRAFQLELSDQGVPPWLVTLDNRWDSTVHVNEVDNPVIRSWHGQGSPSQRLREISKTLLNV